MTQGTMKVLGRRIDVNRQGRPDEAELSKVLLTEAYADDRADIAVGTSWSGGALSMTPVAPGVQASALHRPCHCRLLDWQGLEPLRLPRDPQHHAGRPGGPGSLEGCDNLAFLAVDDLYGRDGVSALKDSLGRTQEQGEDRPGGYVPVATTDFTAPMPAHLLLDGQAALGRKYLVVIWRSPNPMRSSLT